MRLEGKEQIGVVMMEDETASNRGNVVFFLFILKFPISLTGHVFCCCFFCDLVARIYDLNCMT